MRRTNTYQLYPTKEQEKVLKEMLVLSSCVFNMANYRFRQAFFKKGKIPSFYKQAEAIQTTEEYQELGRSYAKPMLQKHSELVSIHFKLLKAKPLKRRRNCHAKLFRPTR